MWVAFDAPFSARSQLDSQLLQNVDEPWGGIPFLTFYYLGALCLGYFVGYFLLVCGHEALKTWQKISTGTRLLNRAVTVAVWLTMIASPVGLWCKNIPVIRANDGSLLRELARLTTRGLPAHGAIVLSDDPFILSLAQQELQRSKAADDHILAETRLLPYAIYQQSLHKRFPQRWPALPQSGAPTAALDPRYLMYELGGLAQNNEVYYLHPSFGYYFEPLYPQPHGLVYRLTPYPTNTITPPALTDAVIEENRKFWSDGRPALDRLATLIRKRINDARVLGRWYSRALNWWGVELQKQGCLDEAGQAFASARKLNPENVAAEINWSFNRTLRAGITPPTELSKTLEEKFDRYRTWSTLLAANGPIDDPGIFFRLGQTFASQRLFRQAALQFTRVVQLEPDNVDARLWLASVFVFSRLPDKALEIAGEIRARETSRPLTSNNSIELARLESLARFGQGDTNAAEQLLVDAHQQFPKSDAILDSLVQMYVLANRFTNALAALDEQLKLRPDNSVALLNKAYICMKLEAFDQANAAVAAVLRNDPENLQALLDKGAICIQTKAYKDAVGPLDEVLKLQPNHPLALMNRAIANLQSDQLDAAQRDYEALQKLTPTLHRVYYGLGEIAFRRRDVLAAIKHCGNYLRYAPPDTDEAKQVAERLKQLQASAGR